MLWKAWVRSSHCWSPLRMVFSLGRGGTDEEEPWAGVGPGLRIEAVGII